MLLLESFIQWTRWTWNPWIGCHHVSPGCFNCYADRQESGRWGRDFGNVRRASASVWRKPYQATAQLEAEFPGVPIAEIPVQKRLMFTASMSDVFHAAADDWREYFWQVVRENPKVIFQILTKRHGRIKAHLPHDWGEGFENVWIGVSCENQEWANRRLPVLATIPAKVKFVSFEPLIDKIDLTSETFEGITYDCEIYANGGRIGKQRIIRFKPFDWAIIGGESGNEPGDGPAGGFNYRPCQLEWIEGLARELEELGIPVFIKQTGVSLAKKLGLKSREGGDPSEFPASLQLQNLPIL